MNSLWLALGITFWAEMGDKTQFVALAYAARYPLRYVVTGIILGIAAVMLVSVGIGKFLGILIPQAYLQAGAALCFLVFAVMTLCTEEQPEEVKTKPTRHPVFLIGSGFLLAELGDKTVVTTLTLATIHPWLPIWVGSTLGMALADGLGVVLGRWIGKRIPENVFKWTSALVFFGFALWTGWDAYLEFRK